MKIVLICLLLFLAAPIVAQKQSGKDNWPSFRGDHAAGVADGQNLPEAWDGEKGTAIKWKANIPGLAHSSPIVWDDKIFIATAVSSRGAAKFKPGLYGDGDASDDRSVHHRRQRPDSRSQWPSPRNAHLRHSRGSERRHHVERRRGIEQERRLGKVVKAGPKFELLGKNGVGQLLMATPAISGGMMFVRAERDLFAIGR